MDTTLILIMVNLPGLFMKLGGVKVLEIKKPGLTVLMAAMIPALIPPIKWFIKFTIGDGCCVGGNGSVVHTEIV